jgi:hypothetical protein
LKIESSQLGLNDYFLGVFFDHKAEMAYPNKVCITSMGVDLSSREAAIAAIKIVFPQPVFQLFCSAHARLNTMKEGLPGSCIYGDWPLCVVKK